MNLLDGLAGRRSVYDYAADGPDPAVVKAALDLAVLAPNHHKTRPWRFAVISGAGRDKLADAFGLAARRLGRPVDAARRKAFSAPLYVLFGVRPMLAHPKVREIEEVLAVGAAVQNFMLALHAHDVASIWTTGELARSDEVLRLAGWTEPDDQVVGLVCAGFADGDKPVRARQPTSHEPFTTWIS